jgi:hypothetical protein
MPRASHDRLVNLPSLSVPRRRGTAPATEGPVRIRLIGSLHAASRDRSLHHKKMCSTLDPGTVKGSNVVARLCGNSCLSNPGVLRNL